MGTKKYIWLDMDGTIADLYGVQDWLDYLHAESTFPYEQAGVMVNMSQLAKLLHKVQAVGCGIGILSWTSKSGSDLYNGQVALAKLCWLHKHLPSVVWDEIRIVAYGTPKQHFARTNNDILFDDEAHNRTNWINKDTAYSNCQIIDVLKQIVKKGR